jgi:hypothetical protein
MTAKLRAIAGAQVLLGVIVLAGIWLALPARWSWVDVPGSALGVAALVAAVALLVGARWASKLVRAVLWAELLLGTLTVSLLAAAAAQLAGTYGPVGAGGTVLLAIVALLVLPYLVVLPVLQLRWLQKSG